MNTFINRSSFELLEILELHLIAGPDDRVFKYLRKFIPLDEGFALEDGGAREEQVHLFLGDARPEPKAVKTAVAEVFLSARSLPLTKDAEQEVYLAVERCELTRNFCNDVLLPFFVEMQVFQVFWLDCLIGQRIRVCH